MPLTLNEMRERGFSNPVRVVHTICGGIVFFHDGVPRQKQGKLNPSKVILFNGATPKEGDPIICVHCGYDVRKNQLEFVLNDD
jgi:hypothetical protein